MVPFGAKMAVWVPLATADPLAGLGTNATAGITLGAAALAGTGRVLIKGTLGTTLGAVTLAGTGTVSNRVFGGTLAATLGALTFASAGKVLVRGALGSFPTMDAWTPLAAVVPLAGPYPLAAATLAASGMVGNQVFGGTFGTLLGALTVASTGKVLVRGRLDTPRIATWTPLAEADPLAGAYQLEPLSLAASSSGTFVTWGTLGATLGALTVTTAGNMPVMGALAVTLSPTRVFAAGSTRIIATGTLARTLGPATLSASGSITTAPARSGTLAVTLGLLTLQARGYSFRSDVWPHDWCPAPGAGRTNTLAVETVPFGDGYAHRITRGLNPVRPTLTYAFPFVGLDDLRRMDAFLKTHGVGGFAFSPPDAETPIWVSCDEWSASIVDRSGAADLVGTLQATFVETFNR